MRRPSPLPAPLQDRPFLVQEALAMGVAPRRLQAEDLWGPFRGVRVPVALGWGPVLRARAGLLVCPRGTAVVGLHAVAAAELPLPPERPLSDLMAEPLEVSTPSSFRPWSREGFRVAFAPLPRPVPRTADGGVVRAADADLWALTTWSTRRAAPRSPYPVDLGLVVAERVPGGTAALQAALERMGARPPRSVARALDEVVAATLGAHGAVRGVRQQPAPRADVHPGTALTPGVDGVAARVAPDVRR